LSGIRTRERLVHVLQRDRRITLLRELPAILDAERT
jgi:hypothetical protein